MKRILPLLICILLLCGCADTGSLRTVAIAEQTFTVDIYYKTVTDGKYTYSYELVGADVVINYPDGSWYQEPYSTSGAIYWSDDYDSSEDSVYTRGSYLVDAVAKVEYKEPVSPAKLIAGIFLLIIGTVNTIWPHLSWVIHYALWFKNVEPTDFAIGYTRVSGVVCIIAGILFLVT